MSSSDRFDNSSRPQPRDAVASRATANETPYGSWIDRVQRARGRHAAITKNLYSLSQYKNWADKVRGDWDETKKD
ncbi:MAG: hypothetical protein R3E77_14445 [Steroidobacteraceae bacterium]